jgi:hypothetical protein
MSEIKDTLNVVLQKVAANKVNVNAALAQAQATIVQADEETVAAAKVLIAKFSNPQGAMQILQNVYQIDALADTSKEMDAMIAGLQTVLTNESAAEAAALQLAANVGAANSPLSGAGAVSGVDPVADAGQSSEAAPSAA